MSEFSLEEMESVRAELGRTKAELATVTADRDATKEALNAAMRVIAIYQGRATEPKPEEAKCRVCGGLGGDPADSLIVCPSCGTGRAQ